MSQELTTVVCKSQTGLHFSLQQVLRMRVCELKDIFVILQNPFQNRLAEVLKQQIANGLFDEADDTWTEIMNVISSSSNNVVFFFGNRIVLTFLLSVYED